MSLLRLRLIAQAPIAVFIIIAIATSSLIPILAPSLTVRLGDPNIRDIQVPTLALYTDQDIGAVDVVKLRYDKVSEAWDRVAVEALISNKALGWEVPKQCAPECDYNVTYSAAALRCSDLAPNQISNADPRSASNSQETPAAILSGYNLNVASPGVLNFTIQIRNISDVVSPDTPAALRDHYGITLAFLPFNNTDFENPDSPPIGSQCTFYNATYAARVSFFNGTQANDVHVLEYHDPLNSSYLLNSVIVPDDDTSDYLSNDHFLSGVGAHVNLLAMADSISKHLVGEMRWGSVPGVFLYDGNADLILKTDLFNMISNPIKLTTSLNLNFAGGITNLSQSLTDLASNVTLNFMNLNLGNTVVPARIPSRTSVYRYNRKSLIATYFVATAVMVVAAIAGLTCLVSNGVPSSNSFSQIMVTTRNEKLDYIASGACLGSDAVHTGNLGDVRLRFGLISSSGQSHERHAAFGVENEESIDAIRKGDVLY